MTRKKLGGSTINVLLVKLQKMLSWARKHKAINVMSEIDKVKVDHKERPHYDMAQIHQLRAMFDGLSDEDAVVFLLAFEDGLRTDEIAALRWEDIDVANGVIKIRRTLSRGVEGPPKGTVGDVGLTNSLIKALARLEKRGPRVLYRCSHFAKGVYAGYSSGSVRIALNRMQRNRGGSLLRSRDGSFLDSAEAPGAMPTSTQVPCLRVMPSPSGNRRRARRPRPP